MILSVIRQPDGHRQWTYSRKERKNLNAARARLKTMAKREAREEAPPVFVTGRVIFETERAVKVALSTGDVQETLWIPKSVLENPDDVSVDKMSDQTFAVAGWFAAKEGLQ